MALQWILAKVTGEGESKGDVGANGSLLTKTNEATQEREASFDPELTLDQIMAQVKVQIGDEQLDLGDSNDGEISRRESLGRRQSHRRSLRTTSALDVFRTNLDNQGEQQSKIKKTQSTREPGLRSMLYGLTQKQKKEEQQARKLMRKQLGELSYEPVVPTLRATFWLQLPWDTGTEFLHYFQTQRLVEFITIPVVASGLP
ncbi:unnamed protein product, partial [Mesorhabditis spiculigera]